MHIKTRHCGLLLLNFFSLLDYCQLHRLYSLSTTADYMSVAIDNFGPFSNAVRRQCTEISIVLDSNPENNENFKVTILENTDGVSIVDSGGMTTVTIVDCEYM